jgi:hypothetical protein
MPIGWWLAPPTKTDKSVKQSHFLLAVLVHKNNPDIVSNSIDAPAGITHDTMWKAASDEKVQAIASFALAQGSTCTICRKWRGMRCRYHSWKDFNCPT